MLPAVLALQLAACVDAFAMYKDRIPNGDNVMDCDQNLEGGVGHIRSGGGGDRNPFGLDFAEAGLQWTPELCNKDSDGDGLTNGRELGDPECTWSVGQSPQFDRGITHPGVNCDARNCETGEGVLGMSSDGDDPPFGCEVHETPSTLSQAFTFSGHPVGNGTSYIMQAFTWQQADAHITKFEMVTEHTQVNHHMIIYRCPRDMSDQFGTPALKGKMECPLMVMAWAVGGKDFCPPQHLGFALHTGEFFVLEMHFDNPNNLQGIVDHSGMILRGIEKAGSPLADAGIALMGIELENTIVPPRKAAHRATVGFQASAWADMNETIYIFSYMHHLHKLGTKQWLRATWEETGEEAGEIACNTNYDFDLQEVAPRRQVFEFKRGMNMTLDCVWDSSDKDEITYGGDETDDEMCVFIFMFWPPAANTRFAATDLNVTWSDTADKICNCPEGGVPESPNDGGVPLAVVVAAVVLVVGGVAVFVLRAMSGDKSRDFAKQTDDVEMPEN